LRAFEQVSEWPKRCPPAAATVGAYLADRADSLRVATLNRQLAAITAAHRMAGQGFVCDRRVRRIVLAGIRRA